MDLQDKLYSSTEVAEILGVSLRSVYRYLDDGKIVADIKTATGRHRFSKKNIEDFLYPSGNAPVSQAPRIEKPVKEKPSASRPRANSGSMFGETPAKPAAKAPSAKEEEEVEDTGYIDWLEKFRAAREQLSKSKAPEPAVDVKPVVPVQSPVEAPVPVAVTPPPASPQPEPVPAYKFEPQEAPVHPQSAPVSTVSSEPLAKPVEPPQPPQPVVPVAPAPEPVPAPQPVPAPVQAPAPAEPTEGFFYYTSAITNLKDLAHSLHKFASSSLTPYAFTAYAGMSLYKSIKPFSILHVYIKPEHKSFFEKVLQLIPSDKNSAQLCLISTSDSFVFDTIKEMHGLKVVSLIKLKKDLLEVGEDALASDLDTLQG